MKTIWRSLFFVSVIGLITVALLGRNVNSAAAEISSPFDNGVIIGEALSVGVSQPASELARAQETEFDPTLVREINPRHNPLQFESDMGRRDTWDRTNVPTDPLINNDPSRSATAAPAPILSFDGVGNPTGCGGCSPPDVVGDVGPNHYVQMVNATKVAVFDKSGNPQNTPFNLGTLWNSGNCRSNAGDPIVNYDPIADRWVLSQFQFPAVLCFAVSQTPDPLGAYYTYTYNVGSFPDYFKVGVWTDAYYVTANENSYTAYAFDRAKMLVGDPTATFQKFTGQNNLLLPIDIDGSTLPPSDSPGVFYTFKDNNFHGGGADRIEVFEMDVNWNNPGQTTFTLAESINVSPFTYTPCGFFNFNCIRQQGTNQRFDALGEWPMFRFPYRNMGTHEALVGTFTVGGGLGEQGSAIRWFELRKTGNDWNLHQEGSFDPGDGNDRMNSSIAMDACGNIAIGYTVSSSSLRPAIRYTTRLASDPLGTMGTEMSLIEGGGSQTASSRWGDYSALTVDPADDTTFWFTNEYYTSNSGSTWKTRIGTWQVCTNQDPDFAVAASPASLDICPGDNAIYNVAVNALNGFSGNVSLSASGNTGTASFATNPVAAGGNTDLTISGASVGSTDITITGQNGGDSRSDMVTLNVLAGAPAAPTLNSPSNGANGVPTNVTLAWNAVTGATMYTVQVATDAGFNNIVASNTGSGTSFSPAGLAANSTYYWRVSADNTCGGSNFSSAFDFSTTAVTEDISVDAEPTSSTEIPNCGGSFTLDVTLTNNTGSSQSFDGWVIAGLPVGADRLILGPVSLNLNAGQSVTYDLSQSVPGNAPAGTYTYNFLVGDYPVADATDSFPVLKTNTGCLTTVDSWDLIDLATGEIWDGTITEPTAVELSGQAIVSRNPIVIAALSGLLVISSIGLLVTNRKED